MAPAAHASPIVVAAVQVDLPEKLMHVKSSAWRRRFSKHENLTFQAMEIAKVRGQVRLALASRLTKKGGVVSRWYLHRGDDLKAFKASIPSLQVAASFACSVASLSRSPAFQLPGHHHLHDEVLADHQFDWGGLSTCTAAHAQCLLTPSPSQNLQELPPSKMSPNSMASLFTNSKRQADQCMLSF